MLVFRVAGRPRHLTSERRQMHATLILVLIAMLVWFGATIVRLESYRYAVEVGLCGTFGPLQLVERQACLDSAETRTSWVWHLYSALVQK